MPWPLFYMVRGACCTYVTRSRKGGSNTGCRVAFVNLDRITLNAGHARAHVCSYDDARILDLLFLSVHSYVRMCLCLCKCVIFVCFSVFSPSHVETSPSSWRHCISQLCFAQQVVSRDMWYSCVSPHIFPFSDYGSIFSSFNLSTVGKHLGDPADNRKGRVACSSQG